MNQHQPGYPQPGPNCTHGGPCPILHAAGPARIQSELRPLITKAGPDLGGDPITYPINDGLVVVLTAKGPHYAPDNKEVLVVANHVAASWGISPSTLWQQAWANLRTEQTSGQMLHSASGDKLHIVFGVNWEGAPQVYRLAEVIGEQLPHGALVMMPTTNLLLALTVRSRGVLSSVPYVMNVAAEFHGKDAESLSMDVFWYHGGVLKDLQATRLGPEDARFSGLAARELSETVAQLP